MTIFKVDNKMRQKETAILTMDRIHNSNKTLVITRTTRTSITNHNIMIMIKKQTLQEVMPIARVHLAPLLRGTITNNISSTIQDFTAVITTLRKNSKTSTIDTAQCLTEAIIIPIKNLPTINHV